jgi:hypothetical protein
MNSPGFWDVLGKLNPLETIREYMNDRNGREPIIQEGMHLDNDIKRLELVEKTTQLLTANGFTDDEVRQMVKKMIGRPLNNLRQVDGKFILETDEDQLLLEPVKDKKYIE